MAADIGDHDRCNGKQHDDQQPRYRDCVEISRGSYGVVFRAVDTKTGEIVAIKEEFDGLSSHTTAREISILQSLPRHPSIVEFKNAMLDDDGRVFVVMEYVASDLHTMIAESKKRPFSENEVKDAMWQILAGVAFLHDHGVMHRDIKPPNILVGSDGRLKLCDFGLSKLGGESGKHTPGLVTQWYRAPELLLGRADYTSAVDMWSVGCVMAEMLLGEVAFPGESEVEQVRCISSNLGAAARLGVRLIAAVFGGGPKLTAAGIDLLQRLLKCEPSVRITAREALDHAWFRES